jgi:hypothetical protein
MLECALNSNPYIKITLIAQAFYLPGKRTKMLITNKVTTHFVHLPGAAVSYTLIRDSISKIGLEAG